MSLLNTTDYKQFKTLDSNRPVSEKHVQKLLKQISIKNLLRLNPIIVDKQKNIIDGQHRLEVAKRLKCPIYYIVDDEVCDNDIANLNSNKSNWSLPDYLKFYCSKGNENYIRLKKFIAKHPKVTVIVAIYITTNQNKQTLSTAYKDGLFVFDNEEKASDLLAKVDDFKEFDSRFERSFIVALEQCMTAPEYDHETMLRKVQMQPGKLKRQANQQQYVELLEEIFNYKSSVSFANFRLTVAQRAKIAAKKQKELARLSGYKKRDTQSLRDEKKFASRFLKKDIVKGEPNRQGKIKAQLDSKTIVYVVPGTDLNELRRKYKIEQEVGA